MEHAPEINVPGGVPAKSRVLNDDLGASHEAVDSVVETALETSNVGHHALEVQLAYTVANIFTVWDSVGSHFQSMRPIPFRSRTIRLNQDFSRFRAVPFATETFPVQDEHGATTSKTIASVLVLEIGRRGDTVMIMIFVTEISRYPNGLYA